MNDETATNIEYLGEVRKGVSSVLKVSVGDYQGRPYIYVLPFLDGPLKLGIALDLFSELGVPLDCRRGYAILSGQGVGGR